MEIEVIERNGQVYPINGYETCDYRYPGKRSLSGQYCKWGYENPQGKTQCEFFGGTTIKIVDADTITLCKCKRIKSEDL